MDATLLIVRPTGTGACCDDADCCGDEGVSGETLVEGSTCELPWETQIGVLRHRLGEHAPALVVSEVDLWQMGVQDRSVALDGLRRELPLPFVILDHTIVSAGRLDMPAILTAVAKATLVH